MRHIVIASFTVLVLAACGSEDAPRMVDAGGQPQGDGATGAKVDQADEIVARLEDFPLGELTDAELAGLQWMREEEKLAHDLYTALGERFGLDVFRTIAAQEQAHTAAVLALLDRYDLEDPVAGLGIGEFSDPSLQVLHDDLLAQGSTSLEAALSVGALLEEVDLTDLDARATDVPDLAFVYADLARGSRNHVRLLVAELARLGSAYEPLYLGQADYDSIVNSDLETAIG